MEYKVYGVPDNATGNFVYMVQSDDSIFFFRQVLNVNFFFRAKNRCLVCLRFHQKKIIQIHRDIICLQSFFFWHYLRVAFSSISRGEVFKLLSPEFNLLTTVSLAFGKIGFFSNFLKMIKEVCIFLCLDSFF